MLKINLLARLLALALPAVLLFSTDASAQTLSLADAIRQALGHNQTILYNAEQQFQIAQAQLKAAEAAYRRTLNTHLAFIRTYSHNESTSAPQ